MDASNQAGPPLALLLLVASRWFDTRSLEELERRGWPRLSSAQSLAFAHLDETGTSPAELARRLGHSRQATHELVAGLVRLGLLEMADDPRRRGGRLILLTPLGRSLVHDAATILRDLEASLGIDRARSLRRLLADFEPAARKTTPPDDADSPAITGNLPPWPEGAATGGLGNADVRNRI